jgi:multiple sugar transport system ATP-binding protein
MKHIRGKGSMGSVNLRNIRKSFGLVEVLHGIDVEVADGEFVVLVGPSGCGKSTLLRSLAGLETISAGEIEIAGRSVAGAPPKDRDIAMVFQNYALYPHMTVADNMAFSLKLARAGRDVIARKVREAAAILDIEMLLHRYPRQLSGGQRQRVAMGRAIVRDPQVFLFDEPLSNLDAKLRVQMRTEIKELHQRLGSTIVYVTHDQIEAMTMADRIVVMRDGRIEQIGAPLELYDHPANRFVAGFIGSPAMNFIPVEVKGADAMAAGQVLTTVGRRSVADGAALILGVRPEDFIVGGGGMQAGIVAVEPTGAETQFIVDIAGHRATVTTRDRVAARAGEAITLSVAPGKAHFFDSATDAAIAEGAAR